MENLYQIDVVKVTELPSINGVCDTYCKISVGLEFKKTKIIKKSLNPKFKEEFDFKINKSEKKINFQIFNEKSDELLDETSILLEDLFEGFSTYTLYGDNASKFHIEIVKPFQIPEESITSLKKIEIAYQSIPIGSLIDKGSLDIIYDPNYLNTSVFCNKDGELIYYFNANGMWENYSLGKCSGDISVVKHKHDIFLFFVDQNNHLNFQKKTQGSWISHKKSFEKYRVKERISAIFEIQRDHPAVFFKDDNGIIHYAYYESEWKVDNKSFQNYPCIGDLSAVYEENRNHAGLFYHGENNKIHHWYVEKKKWIHDTTSFSKTNIGGCISAIYNSSRSHSEIFVVSEYSTVIYYSHNVNWKIEDNLFDQEVYGDLQACYNPISGSPEVIYTSKLGGLEHYSFDIENKWKSVSHFESKPFSPIGITFSDHRKSIEFFYMSYDHSGHYYYNSGLHYIHETNSFSDGLSQLNSTSKTQVQQRRKMKIKIQINCAYNLPKSTDGSEPDSACEISVEGQTDTTKSISSDLNPVWNETFQFEIKNLSSPLYLTVFDSKLISKDIGSITVNLEELDEGLNKLLLQLPDQGTLSADIKTEGFGKVTEKPITSNNNQPKFIQQKHYSGKIEHNKDDYSGVIEETEKKQKEYQSSSKILPFLFSHGSVDIVYEPSRSHIAIVSNVKGKLTYYFYGEDNSIVKDNISLPECKGDISVVWEKQRDHIGIFYEGKNGFLSYSYWNNEKWNHSNENAFMESGKIGGRICAVYEPQRNHPACFFVGDDGSIHYWYVRDGIWKHDCKSFEVKCHGDLSVVYEKHKNHSAIFYEGPDNQLVYYYVDKVWKYEKKIFEHHKVGGAISALYNEKRKHSEVYYSGRNAKLNYWYNLNGVWTVDNFSFKEPVLGDLKAIYNPSTESSEVVYSTVSGVNHYFIALNEWKSMLHASSNSKGTISVCYSPIRRTVEFYYLSSSHIGHYHFFNGYNYQHDDKTYN
eukprot:gene1767-536_t